MEYKKIIEQLQVLKDETGAEVLDETMDIIHDYGLAVDQANRLTEKYETVKNAIDRGVGNFQCPTCQKFISFGNEHCHWCGQRLGWEPKAPRTGGKGKCRSLPRSRRRILLKE